VDLSAQIGSDSATGAGWRVAVVAVRPMRPGGNSAPVLSGGTLDRLPQSVTGRGTKPQAEGVAATTEKQLLKIVAATQRKRKPLRGRREIGLAVGKILGRYKMGKHFSLTIEDDGFRCQRKPNNIEREAALDGIYVIRTNVPAQALSSEQVVGSYKRLSNVERAFRSLKSVDLKIRPIYHHLADRVKAHVFLCMLSYYVEWHMRRALAPMLFDDDDPQAAEAARQSIVAPAQRSAKAKSKDLLKRTADGMPVHSFQTLLKDLATLTRNEVRIGEQTMQMLANPTPVQQRALHLLQVSAAM
jgi:hypothetical protein